MGNSDRYSLRNFAEFMARTIGDYIVFAVFTFILLNLFQLAQDRMAIYGVDFWQATNEVINMNAWVAWLSLAVFGVWLLAKSWTMVIDKNREDKKFKAIEDRENIRHQEVMTVLKQIAEKLDGNKPSV